MVLWIQKDLLPQNSCLNCSVLMLMFDKRLIHDIMMAHVGPMWVVFGLLGMCSWRLVHMRALSIFKMNFCLSSLSFKLRNLLDLIWYWNYQLYFLFHLFLPFSSKTSDWLSFMIHFSLINFLFRFPDFIELSICTVLYLTEFP